MKNRILAALLAAGMIGGMLAGCGGTGNDDTKSAAPSNVPSEPEKTEQTLKVAALEGGYGAELWTNIAEAFEKANPGVTVDLTVDKNIEDILTPQMQAGNYPDVVHLATGREKALTENFIRDEELMPLDDVLTMTIPGESVTVGDKIIDGFTDTAATNPYGDGKTYLAPMFYSPCGLWYNAGLFEEKNWEVPTTWDDMWALADTAKAEGISLFTYPTAGYFDAFMFALMNSVGGAEFYNSAMSYEEGIYDTPAADEMFAILEKLASYVEPTTVSNANGDNFTKNQQLVLDNKALFMPNGTWIVGEMGEAPRVDNFSWGFTALPGQDADSRYSFTFMEQAWIPKQAANAELAKTFVAYLYSDEAAKIFADAGAAQPISGIVNMMEDEDQKLFYSIYENGAKAAMGGFAATESIEGLDVYNVFFETFNSVVNGTKSVDEWKAGIVDATNQLRAVMS